MYHMLAPFVKIFDTIVIKKGYLLWTNTLSVQYTPASVTSNFYNNVFAQSKLFYENSMATLDQANFG